MNKIRKIREKQGISLYRLAVMTGLNYRTIRGIENGQDPRLSTLEKIAEALKVSVKDFL